MPTDLNTITTQAAASTDEVLGSAGGTNARLFPLNTLPVGYTPTGTGTTNRTLKTKVEEIERSITEFGGDPTGVADCTTAFNNAKAAGVTRLHFPAGTFRFNSTITIDKSMMLFGEGRTKTTLMSYVSGGNHGMVVIGEPALSRENLIKLIGFKLEYAGTGQTAASGANNCWSGIYIQRKVLTEDLYVRNFTNDGLYFAPADAVEGATSTLGSANQAVFFAEMRNTWSNDHGRDGIRVRYGANANLFVNCQFSRNGGVGFHHVTDGISTYGNVVILGQASYNSSYGYYWESGTDAYAAGLYAEYNGSTDNTDTNGYLNTPYDFFIGDNTSRSLIALGVVFGASYTHVRAPNRGLNDSCMVTHGGMRVYTSTAYRIPTRHTTAVPDLAGGADLATTVAKVNELLAALRTASVIP